MILQNYIILVYTKPVDMVFFAGSDWVLKLRIVHACPIDLRAQAEL